MRADPRLILLLALVIGFFVDLGTPPLFDRDEGAFSEATREMIDSGDFISPTLNFEPRFDKPILIYWAQTPFVLLLGPDAWGFRMASAVAATVWLIALVAFARPRLGHDAGLFAGILLATSLGTMVLARAAIADALLNLWLALAFFDLWRWIEEGRRAPLRRVFLWIALGALTKGPVALVVPGGASLVYFLWRRDPLGWLRTVLDPLGIVIFVVVVAPWYVAQFLREGMAFYQGFFLRHNVDRFSGALEGHGGGFLYYVPVLLVVLLPHTAWFLAALRRVGGARTDDLARFAWSWLAFVFVFFSVSGTKLPHYVLLAATPLVLLMARERERLHSRVALLVPPVLLFALLFALPDLVPLLRERLRDPYFEAVLGRAPEVFATGYRVAVGTGFGVIVALGLFTRGERWRASAYIGLVQAFVLVRFVVPAFGDLLQGPVREASVLARDLGAPVVRHGLDHPSISVYLRTPTERRPPRTGELAITTARGLDALGADGGGPLELLYESGGIRLVRRRAPEPARDASVGPADSTTTRSSPPGSRPR